MDQLLSKAVQNHIAGSPTHLEKLLVPLVVSSSVPNANKISKIHHPISVIDAVPANQLEVLASSISTLQRLNRQSSNRDWWLWCYVYTQLRVSTLHAPVSDIKIGTRAPSSVQVVQQQVDDLIDGLGFDELEQMSKEVAEVHSQYNQEYWDHLLYLIQSRAAFLKLDQLYNDLKPKEREATAEETLIDKVQADLPDNELLFDSGTSDPEFAARAVIGQAPNYQDKNAVVHDEPWLNSSVKGYKFTIRYKAIAVSDIPKYKLERCDDGTAHLVFSASNYPDLRFNVINRPWDRGRYAEIKFVSTFERGTVELQFGFREP